MLMSLSACAITGADGGGADQVRNAVAPELAAGAQLLPLSFQFSGGFAGRVEVLDIAADGLATWTDLRSRTTRSQQLPPPDLVHLRALLAEIPATEIDEGGSRFPGRCRDCFEYRLSIASRDNPLKIVVSSGQLSASAYRELISTLLFIVDDIKRKKP